MTSYILHSPRALHVTLLGPRLFRQPVVHCWKGRRVRLIGSGVKPGSNLFVIITFINPLFQVKPLVFLCFNPLFSLPPFPFLFFFPIRRIQPLHLEVSARVSYADAWNVPIWSRASALHVQHRRHQMVSLLPLSHSVSAHSLKTQVLTQTNVRTSPYAQDNITKTSILLRGAL